MKQSRSVQYDKSIKDPKVALRGRLQELAYTRVRYGYRQLHVLLKREGWQLGKSQASALQRRAIAATVKAAQASEDGAPTSGEGQTDPAQRGVAQRLWGGPAGRWHQVAHANHCWCL